MNLFKSIVSSILTYAVVACTFFFGAYMITDVYNYANDTLAIETQCRDGNYDAAKVYQVKKANDGSYTVEYAGRDLDDLIIKSYYDTNGNYLYTEKETGQYVITDIFGTIGVGLLLSAFAYFTYLVLTAIAELAVTIANKIKEKKVKKAAVLAENDPIDDNPKGWPENGHYIQH